VYIILCKNNKLYTGQTNQPSKRFEQHNSGTGAKFIRAFGFKRVEYISRLATRSEAMREEHRIKRLPKLKKLSLIEENKDETRKLLFELL
jgi:putative endonuclease